MALLKVFFDTFTPLFDLNSGFVEQTKHVLVIENRRAPVTAAVPSAGVASGSGSHSAGLRATWKAWQTDFSAVCDSPTPPPPPSFRWNESSCIGTWQFAFTSFRMMLMLFWVLHLENH